MKYVKLDMKRHPEFGDHLSKDIDVVTSLVKALKRRPTLERYNRIETFLDRVRDEYSGTNDWHMWYGIGTGILSAYFAFSEK